MSLQFVDYPMDNHRLPFREVRDACAARRLSTIGFGGTVAFFTGIPLLNLVVIPAAVIGATLLWCEELSRNVRFCRSGGAIQASECRVRPLCRAIERRHLHWQS
ncbi:MAG: hypothetical protein CM15mP89_0230 [Gammaproteobacteria bacterium]|nr:MAG: hypothetical protein CM15mP89_0230 [Gammaproteobacteria bacterium]